MKASTKKSIIYAYRLTDDTGNAPCIFDLSLKPTRLLTLACCMGGRAGMRHTIGKNYQNQIADGQTEVFVMGIFNNELLYFAQITEIVTMLDYFVPENKYRNRLDCIYDALPKGDYIRNENNPNFHSKICTKKHISDWNGEYVLISNCFAYFGRESIPMSSDLLGILPTGVGHKFYNGNFSQGIRIFDEVWMHWNFSDVIQNKPHDFPPKCNNTGC